MGLDAIVEWIAVVPVKASRDAKTRLADHPERSALARAMAQDAVTALLDAERIADVVVVADGVVDTAWARTVIPGPGSGLNAAIGVGAQWAANTRSSAFGLVVVTADLPCLTADAVDHILALREEAAVRIVGDAAGTGTTMLLVRDGRTVPKIVTPKFGPHSCAAHVEAGAVNLTTEGGIDANDQAALLRARRDVDTDVDLWDAIRIGVGPATRAALMSD
jgi:2-phospho-L-lactate guanylyltransferase